MDNKSKQDKSNNEDCKEDNTAKDFLEDMLNEQYELDNTLMGKRHRIKNTYKIKNIIVK